MGPARAILADGRRHFQHGPIDLILAADGPQDDVAGAYKQAWVRFDTILEELVAELPSLRRPVEDKRRPPQGPTAQRMWQACWPHRAEYVTPMAAVAGAVADEILAAMVDGRDLDRAYVNDGGDIALYLTAGHHFDAGIVTELAHPSIDGKARIDAGTSVRGIATSGRDGRSFSRGIADSVTVLAADAASADVAATLIGNAVDIDHPAVRRVPAMELDPDSDLGDRLVTVDVGPLDDAATAIALDAGAAKAATMRARGLLSAALLTLRGRCRIIGDLPTALGDPAALRIDHGVRSGSTMTDAATAADAR